MIFERKVKVKYPNIYPARNEKASPKGRFNLAITLDLAFRRCEFHQTAVG